MHPAAMNLESANLKRTQYLLSHYPQYRAEASEDLDLKTSQSVLDILSYSLADREQITDHDFDLIDRCGSLLPPALMKAAESIRYFPHEISSMAYPVLYHQYFYPDGIAISTEQLHRRLIEEGTKIDFFSLPNALLTSEKIMTSLLFPNRFVYAMYSCS